MINESFFIKKTKSSIYQSIRCNSSMAIRRSKQGLQLIEKGEIKTRSWNEAKNDVFKR